MKKIGKYLLKELGINRYMAIKAMYWNQSEGLFNMYESLKMSLHYKKDKETILYRFTWEHDGYKDFAQYPNKLTNRWQRNY